MLRIGLTGGIGSGKSTVSKRLAELGALVIDADRIARDVVEPGTPGLQQIRQQFGDAVITSDGALDRPALGAIVFADGQKRRDLEAITHPLIAQRTEQLFAQADPDAIVVHDMPLLIEIDQADRYHLLVVVDAPQEIRVARLVEHRGMNRQDALARMTAQATDQQRREAADVLLDNSGTPQALRAAVDVLWADRLVEYAENIRLDRPVRRPSAVHIAEYDPQWAAAGQRWCSRIATQLGIAGEQRFVVDHIGSTSVPGLAAKPVLDLQLQVPDLAVAEQDWFRRALRSAGIVAVRPNSDHPQPWAPDPAQWTKFYANGADPEQVVHLHIRAADGPAARIALQFRDWLRANPSAREEYAQLKRHLAQQHPGGTEETRQDYVEAKEPWFAQNLQRAREWAQHEDQLSTTES